MKDILANLKELFHYFRNFHYICKRNLKFYAVFDL